MITFYVFIYIFDNRMNEFILKLDGMQRNEVEMCGLCKGGAKDNVIK